MGTLAHGDAARLTATGGRRVTALDEAEVGVWEMHGEVVTAERARAVIDAHA